MSDWLNTLKAGDSVVYCSGTYGKGVGKVARVTPTQIILEGGGRYRRRDGDTVGGGGWIPQYITQPTDALLLEIRKKFLCDNLRKIVWEKISVGVLADIYDKAKNGQHLKPDISTQDTSAVNGDNNDPIEALAAVAHEGSKANE